MPFPRIIPRRKTAKRRPVPREHRAQCEVMAWAFHAQRQIPELILLHASFNPGKLPIQAAKKMKREGAKAGFPDLSLPVARGGWHGLFIEMKYGKRTQTPQQKVIAEKLGEQGYRVEVCRSAQNAIEMLRQYIQLPSTEVQP